MANVLEEIKSVLNNNGLQLDDIKCFTISFWVGTELVDYGPYSHEEPKYETINLPTYEGDDKPAMYDEYREAKLEDIAEIGSIEGFGTVWLNNGDWLYRPQPQLEEVYPSGWGYETVPVIPKSLILDKFGNKIAKLNG
tara:strand:+ start:8676 stop:9089 length:414 start_codon:yes stop_codon:yes gene_type:complete